MLLRSLNLKAPDASPRNRVRRHTRLAALIALAVIAVFIVYMTFGRPLLELMSMQMPPPPTVSTEIAATRAYQPTLTAVGTLTAVQGVDLTAEVDGVVREVFFRSGDEVAANAKLVRLDDEVPVAALKQRQADADNAQREFERNEKVARQGHISQSGLDAARLRRDQAVAAVAEAQALADQKMIKAPFAGRTGVRRVNVGEFVKSGTSIVTLQTLKPIYVNFNLTEQALAQVAVGQTVTLTTDTFPGTTFTGTLTSFDPGIDPGTRNFLAQATLGNEDGKLAPGMFAHLRLSVGAPLSLVSVPETAISYSLYGDSVFVVVPSAEDLKGKSKGKGQPPTVEQRRVDLGESRDGWVAIKSGLKDGEQVVTAGQIKLRPGAPVTVDNSVALVPAASPKY